MAEAAIAVETIAAYFVQQSLFLHQLFLLSVA